MNYRKEFQQMLDIGGEESQIEICIEELAECIMALQKFKRARRNPNQNPVKQMEAAKNVCEELADVIVTTLQITYMFGESNQTRPAEPTGATGGKERVTNGIAQFARFIDVLNRYHNRSESPLVWRNQAKIEAGKTLAVADDLSILFGRQEVIKVFHEKIERTMQRLGLTCNNR